MRKRIKIMSLLLALCVLGVSCAKKEGPQTAYTRMIGKWKKTKYATDDNNNGIIDPGEISAQPANVDNELFFKADGTGQETTVFNKEPITPLNYDWTIVNGDSLRITYKANDTLTYSINNVTAVDLTLTIETPQGLAWYYYVKL